MTGWTTTRVRRRARAVLVLAMFGLLVLASPLLHHDFACHTKSPAHCTGCVSSPSGLRGSEPFRLACLRLAEPGPVELGNARVDAAESPFFFWGRPPPA